MAALVLAIVLHATLGLALAGLVWSAGLGCLPRDLPAVHAYAPGLLAVSAAAVLFLLEPWLGLVGAALLAALLRRALRRARRPPVELAWALPAGLALPTSLGLLLHGPTDGVDSHAYGDLVFYAARLVSAARSLLPLRDTLVAGQSGTYVEGGSTFLGAPLTHLPSFDPLLFQTTTLSAFGLASLAGGLALVRPRTRGALAAAGLALLAVAVLPYPTWVTESPPVALALPLTFGVHALRRDRPRPAWLVALAAIVGVDLVLTKAFGVLPLGTLIVLAAIHRRRELLAGRRATFAAGAALLAGAGLLAFSLATSGWLTEIFTFKFLPADAARGLWDQLSRRDTHEAAPAFLVAGEVALAFALARAGARDLLAALAVSVAGNWIVGGHGFDVGVGMSVLLVVLHFSTEPGAWTRARTTALTAGALLAISAWLREIAGFGTGFALAALLGASLLLPLARPRSARAATLGLAVLALALALGVRQSVAPRATTLTSEHHGVWQTVSQVVPRDGLVFTDQTGRVVDGDHGWNYYPGLAGRQVYLGGWYDSVLQVRDAELERRLRLNREVLSGRLPPSRARHARGFGAYFAVLRRGAVAPRGSRLLYSNRLFALYRLSA